MSEVGAHQTIEKPFTITSLYSLDTIDHGLLTVVCRPLTFNHKQLTFFLSTLHNILQPIMILAFIFCLTVFVQDEIAFKAKDEFEVKLDYTFKQRPASENNSIQFDAHTQRTENQNSSSMLPYLVLNVTILKTSPEEVKARIVRNKDNSATNKKIYDGVAFAIDLGFTDDVKDRVTSHEYIIYLLNEKKKEQSKIVIFVKEDGTFLINDEVRGKF